MAIVALDCFGLKCPQPIMRITAQSVYLKAGDILEVSADCPTFDKDIHLWCKRTKKTLIWIKDEGGMKRRCQIKF